MSYLKYIAVFFFLACNQQPHIKTGLEGKPMPNFRILSINGQVKEYKDIIQNDKPTVLFFFSPICPYCRAQTQTIIDNFKYLGNIQFCFISPFPLDYIKSFNEHYKLSNYPNVVVVQDVDSSFENYFRARTVPFLAIYDRRQTLKQVFKGKVNISSIQEIALK